MSIDPSHSFALFKICRQRRCRVHAHKERQTYTVMTIVISGKDKNTLTSSIGAVLAGDGVLRVTEYDWMKLLHNCCQSEMWSRFRKMI